MWGDINQKVGQIQNVVFLGDPDKEQERLQKKWLIKLLVEHKEELKEALKEESK